MRRYQLILGGTAAGIAGVLAFPTRTAHLTIPSAGSAGASSPTTVAGPGSPGSGAGSTPSGPSAQGSASTGATRSATGADESFQYGDIAVTVTVAGSKITHVGIAQIDENDGRSAGIDSYAVPQLEQQVLSADSANISGVSGATFTSQAFVDSLSSALDKLGFKR